MPKIKIPRKNISLDMTAMCDVAFLLLSFFILTTTFRPEEPIAIDSPSSVSDIELPEKNNIIISVGKKGEVFYAIDPQDRLAVLEKVTAESRIPFTDRQKAAFQSVAAVGVPLNQLPGYLDIEKGKRNALPKVGIPIDTPTTSDKNELRTWLRASIAVARTKGTKEERKLTYTVKGDGATKYDNVKWVISTLQDFNINTFNLITSLERKKK
jgi:biopolymer transport protein ExbD